MSRVFPWSFHFTSIKAKSPHESQTRSLFHGNGFSISTSQIQEEIELNKFNMQKRIQKRNKVHNKSADEESDDEESNRKPSTVQNNGETPSDKSQAKPPPLLAKIGKSSGTSKADLNRIISEMNTPLSIEDALNFALQYKKPEYQNEFIKFSHLHLTENIVTLQFAFLVLTAIYLQFIYALSIVPIYTNDFISMISCIGGIFSLWIPYYLRKTGRMTFMAFDHTVFIGVVSSTILLLLSQVPLMHMSQVYNDAVNIRLLELIAMMSGVTIITQSCLPTVEWNVVLALLACNLIAVTIALVDSHMYGCRLIAVIAMGTEVYVVLSRHYERVGLFVSVSRSAGANIIDKDAIRQIQRNRDEDAAALRMMVANTAHDLKTPLAAIVGGMSELTPIVTDVLNSCQWGVDVNKLRENAEEALETLVDMKNTSDFMYGAINRCQDYAKIAQVCTLFMDFNLLNLLMNLLIYIF